MKIDKLWNGLKRIANGDYVLEGDLISEETIEIDLNDRFVVRGRIQTKKSIVVRCGIEAGCGIKAGEGIKAGWGIEAGCGIEAGEGIKAEKFIDVQKRIFAGISVYRTSRDCDKTIRCAELRNGEICYGDLTLTKEGKPDEG